jgi:hypothetical protein
MQYISFTMTNVLDSLLLFFWRVWGEGGCFDQYFRRGNNAFPLSWSLSYMTFFFWSLTLCVNCKWFAKGNVSYWVEIKCGRYRWIWIKINVRQWLSMNKNFYLLIIVVNHGVYDHCLLFQKFPERRVGCRDSHKHFVISSFTLKKKKLSNSFQPPNTSIFQTSYNFSNLEYYFA